MKRPFSGIMSFCRIFRDNSIYPDTSIDQLTLGGTDLEPSLVIFSLHREDKEMIKSLTERMVKMIRVEGSVVSLLGAIFEIYMRNGFIGERMEKTNFRNIFDDSVIVLLQEYYGHNPDVLAVIEQYCYIKDIQTDGDDDGLDRDRDICPCCVIS